MVESEEKECKGKNVFIIYACLCFLKMCLFF